VDLQSPNAVIHIVTGAIALIVGLVPLLSSKGGRVHRRSGRYAVGLGAIVIATAVISVVFDSAPMALAAVTLSASYQYVGSLRALALRDRGPGWPDALLACIALALSAWMLIQGKPGGTSWPPALAYGTLGYLAAVVFYDLSRHLWPQLWLRRIRPLDHGLKMTGFYFAMASAGAGNLLRGWQPWSQLLPSSIGLMLMLVFAILFFRRQTRAHHTAPA
jgi:hypothetical protein